MAAMRRVIAVSSRFARMGHIAVTLVDRVAWARARIRGRSGATLNDISSLTLTLPPSLPQSLFSFSLPFLLAVSIAQFAFVVALRLRVVAEVRGGPHPLVIVVDWV
jgi:hypothetical protein